MQIKILKLTPMLKTKKLKDTVQFYTAILGFRCDSMDQEVGWAHVNKDEINIMFLFPMPIVISTTR
jgi:catechol 2,3-dioxygenase-like lactoylglutathione lyase family enzyme